MSSHKNKVYTVYAYLPLLRSFWQPDDGGPVGGLKCVAVLQSLLVLDCKSVHLFILTKFFFTFTGGMKLARKEASGWF